MLKHECCYHLLMFQLTRMTLKKERKLQLELQPFGEVSFYCILNNTPHPLTVSSKYTILPLLACTLLLWWTWLIKGCGRLKFSARNIKHPPKLNHEYATEVSTRDWATSIHFILSVYKFAHGLLMTYFMLIDTTNIQVHEAIKHTHTS